MAIAIDTTGHNETFNQSTLSATITVGSLTNGILIIGLHRDFQGPTITSVLVDGSSTGVVSLGSVIFGGDSNPTNVYYFLNPSAGTRTVAVTLSAIEFPSLTLVSYSGVNQTTPFGTPVTASGSSTTATVNVTTTVGQLVMDVVTWGGAQAGRTATVGAGQTQRINIVAGADGGAHSDETATGTTTTMSWAMSIANQWTMLAAVMNPASSATAYSLPLAGDSYGVTGADVIPFSQQIQTWLRVSR